MWQLSHLDSGYPKIRITLVLIIQGVGSGLVFAPTLVAAMNSVSDRFAAQVSATRSMTRHVSAAIGVAVLGAISSPTWARSRPSTPPLDDAQAAYNRLFLVALWIVIVAIALAAFLPGRPSKGSHHSRRLVEDSDQGT